MASERKIAVVTGGGRGIGESVAKVLASRGIAVAIWDLNAEGAERTAASIRESGGSALALTLDVSDPGAIATATEQTRAGLGPVTILVNNAGISVYEPFESITEDSWDRMIRINLKGPFLVTQAIVPDMLDAGWGRIINISSSSAQSGAAHMGHYAASKGGVIGMTKALAIEFADRGITVNNVPPGFVDTPLLREGRDDAQIEHFAARMPMKRPGKPDDIAYAVAYLASDEAGYVTGQTLSVNGGRYMV